MKKKSINNIKLGVFVLAGLFFLIVLLYMIGKNRSMFGKNFVLKAQFEHVQGLVAGNNVRYAGIEAGTVKKITILNDTLIEVIMIIDTKMEGIIRKNAVVAIGTEGFVGNKVVNILPSKQPAAAAAEGDVLRSKRSTDTDEMLQTLANTNNDVAVIASELKRTVQRINNSQALWALLNDPDVPRDLKASMNKVRVASEKAADLSSTLGALVSDINRGKGSAGMIIKDSSIALNLREAILKIKDTGERADSLAKELNEFIIEIKRDVNSGSGPIHTILKDSILARNLNASLENIRMGTDGFNQNMEALKHNFLLRGYFRKQAKKQQREKSRPANVEQP
jgi:phospholipid/cholesterol/gamma-HCH transport system substrate-binding protein